jgi:hypothetical protein
MILCLIAAIEPFLSLIIVRNENSYFAVLMFIYAFLGLLGVICHFVKLVHPTIRLCLVYINYSLLPTETACVIYWLEFLATDPEIF